MESLVEAVLRRRVEEGERLPSIRGVNVPNDARRVIRQAEHCACGCGAEVDSRRSRLGVSRTCMMRVVLAFRTAPEPLREQLRRFMPPRSQAAQERRSETRQG